MYSPSPIGEVTHAQSFHAASSSDSSELPLSSPASASKPPAQRRRRIRAAERNGPWPAIGLGAVLLIIWQVVTTSGAVPEVFLPSPLAVIERLWLSLTQVGLGWKAWVTLREALLGCLLATVFALPLAWGLYRWRLFSRAVLPYVAASQAVPGVAVAPLLVLWIGYRVKQKTEKE